MVLNKGIARTVLFFAYLCEMINNVIEISNRNTEKARQIVKEARITEIWNSVGAEVRQVGSLRMGLLVKHRDIDFHIYSDKLDIAESFAAITKLAQNSAVKRIEYTNLIDTEEACIEWHAWYLYDNELWQFDMIHILKGSRYDGYFENVADRISAVLTPETKNTILTLKYETPETEKIMGIEYYYAVIEGGVRNYAEFTEWREKHPANGILEWIP